MKEKTNGFTLIELLVVTYSLSTRNIVFFLRNEHPKSVIFASFSMLLFP